MHVTLCVCVCVCVCESQLYISSFSGIRFCNYEIRSGCFIKKRHSCGGWGEALRNSKYDSKNGELDRGVER